MGIDRGAERAGEIGGERGEVGRPVGRLDAALLDAREVEQRVDQLEQAERVALDGPEPLAGERARGRRRRVLDRAQDRLMGGFRQRVLGTRVILNKIALFHNGPGVRLSLSNHAIIGARCSDLRAVHLHFKYLADFRERVADEMARGQVWIHPALSEVVEQALLALIAAFDAFDDAFPQANG